MERLGNPVNLEDNKNNEIGPFQVNNANTCIVQGGHYFDYTGFQRRWLNVTDGIFGLRSHRMRIYIKVSLAQMSNLVHFFEGQWVCCC